MGTRALVTLAAGVFLLVAVAGPANARGEPVVVPPAASLAPTGSVSSALPDAKVAPPPPYSLPWQLRPAGVGTVVRLDTSLAFYKATDAAGAEDGGLTV